MTISPKVNIFYTEADETVGIPCVVLQGYDSGGDATDTEGSVVTADLLLLGYDPVRKTGVTKGTSAGEFAYGA